VAPRRAGAVISHDNLPTADVVARVIRPAVTHERFPVRVICGIISGNEGGDPPLGIRAGLFDRSREAFWGIYRCHGWLEISGSTVS